MTGPQPGGIKSLSVVTWNIHRGRGADGRVDGTRILRTLEREICAAHAFDVLALQEADAEARPHAGIFAASEVETATGLMHAQGPGSRRWGAASLGFLGNAVFLAPRFDVLHADLIDLPGHCPRGAVALEIADATVALRVICTHLALMQALRIVQMRVIGQYVARRPTLPTVLMGDLNEWRPWGGLAFHPRLTGLALHGPARRSFPVRRPILPMDRVLSTPPHRVTRTQTLYGPEIAMASDHRPVNATVEIAADGPRSPTRRVDIDCSHLPAVL